MRRGSRKHRHGLGFQNLAIFQVVANKDTITDGQDHVDNSKHVITMQLLELSTMTRKEKQVKKLPAMAYVMLWHLKGTKELAILETVESCGCSRSLLIH